MKKVIAVLILSSVAGATCVDTASKTEATSESKTPLPQRAELKDGQIQVQLKDGHIYKFSSNEYMIAKRMQTVKYVNTTIAKQSVCKEEAPKNEVLAGIRHDRTSVAKQVQTNSATVQALTNVVLDLSYVRHKALGLPVNLGLGIDTNGTPKGLVGVDF